MSYLQINWSMVISHVVAVTLPRPLMLIIIGKLVVYVRQVGQVKLFLNTVSILWKQKTAIGLILQLFQRQSPRRHVVDLGRYHFRSKLEIIAYIF